MVEKMLQAKNGNISLWIIKMNLFKNIYIYINIYNSAWLNSKHIVS